MKAATKSIKLNVLASAVIAAGLVMSNGAFAGGTAPLTVNAKISGLCKVTTAPGTLDFGLIDPSGLANATASATFVMKCTNGITSTAATDGGATGGLHNGGGFKRMQHSVTATAFLPYAITYSNDTGLVGTGFGAGGATQTVTVNGTVLVADYAGALATTGAEVYADTVTITVNP
jgi:spore coat protein U-like protein